MARVDAEVVEPEQLPVGLVKDAEQQVVDIVEARHEGAQAVHGEVQRLQIESLQHVGVVEPLRELGRDIGRGDVARDEMFGLQMNQLDWVGAHLARIACGRESGIERNGEAAAAHRMSVPSFRD